MHVGHRRDVMVHDGQRREVDELLPRDRLDLAGIDLDRASSCQGKAGCARMIGISGKSTATSSSSMGCEYLSRTPPPPRVAAPTPVCPVWNSAGSLASAIASYSG